MCGDGGVDVCVGDVDDVECGDVCVRDCVKGVDGWCE